MHSFFAFFAPPWELDLVSFSGAWYLEACLPISAGALTSHASFSLLMPLRPSETSCSPFSDCLYHMTPAWLSLGSDIPGQFTLFWMPFLPFSYSSGSDTPREPPPHRETFLTLFGLRFLLLGNATTWCSPNTAQVLMLRAWILPVGMPSLPHWTHSSFPLPYLHLLYATLRL